jgi:Tol biopolymer transport system component
MYHRVSAEPGPLVVSPDGRMVAFFRSDRAFATPDQIYVKLLPGGEPVQVTHDPRLKYKLAFSPDGSQIAYTVADSWDTYTVSSLGGDSRLFLPNASGLSWLGEHRLLFSEINTGVHMGIVTAREDRSEHREIYFPSEQRGMAHYSYPSPDTRWVLVAEMDPQWHPCRLIPFSGDSRGRLVGPPGACTSAAWSPDGAWMYFGVAIGGTRHLWRQRFPDGKPEQITSGLTEEDGLAIAPDGRSLITSISTKQNAIWIHDAGGDRALSDEGYADDTRPPRFSSDGRRLYYLLKHGSPESPNELWRADPNSGSSEAVVPGVSMVEYDISDDEKEVVFTTQTTEQAAQLWIAPLDRSKPARMIGATGEVQPHFGPHGQVLFRLADGNAFYLAKMGRDGSGRAKVLPSPILDFHGISPDRRFVILGLPYQPDNPSRGHDIAFPLDGGPTRNLCDGCQISWSPDGKYLYLRIVQESQANSAGRTLVIPVTAAETFMQWPARGVQSLKDGLAIPGARVVNQSRIGPGLGSTYAYVKPTGHANLFRIPLSQ